MTDRELLELAARAAGIVVVRSRLDDPACNDFLIQKSQRNSTQALGPWNPLTDDGDALRLAVKLNILNTRSIGYEWPDVSLFDAHADDAMAATRRAITRAAAEIGKAMP